MIKAEVFIDDEQIDKLSIERGPIEKGGSVEVTIKHTEPSDE